LRDARARYSQLAQQVQQAEEQFTAQIEAVMAATGLSLDWEDERENDKSSFHEDDAMSSRDEQQVDDLVQPEENDQSGPEEEGPQRFVSGVQEALHRLDAGRMHRLRSAGLAEEEHFITPRRSVAFDGLGPSSMPSVEDSLVADPQPSASRGPAYRQTAWTLPLSGPSAWGPRRTSMAPTITAPISGSREPREDLAYVGPIANVRDGIGVQRLLTMIDEQVGSDPTDEPPAYLKLAKLPAPPQYEGKDDADKFEVWLQSLLEYFSTLRLTGKGFDKDRLRLAGNSLGGNAATWFYNTIKSPTREKTHWTFEEAIVGLYRRFIHRDMHLVAEQQFAALKYDSTKGGVAALYEQMRFHADKMWEKPTDFQMRKKLLETLPYQFEQTLTIYKGLSAQYNTFWEIYQAALEYEQSLRILQSRRNSRETSGTQASTSSSGKASRDAKSGRSHGTSHRQQQRTTANSSGKPGWSYHRPSDNRNYRAPQASASGTRPTSSTNVPRNERGTGPVKCFACGQIGHYASDPTCPKYGKQNTSHNARMFAQQVVHEPPADEEEPVPLEPAEVPPKEEAEEEHPFSETIPEPEADYPESEFGGNGSQYESDREDLPSPIFEEEIEFNGMRVAAIKEIETDLLRAHAMAVQPERNIRHGWLYDAK
ncbi:hypothetical protein C8Q73DRAFT_616036, partial [Cubamyces lactineus]